MEELEGGCRCLSLTHHGPSLPSATERDKERGGWRTWGERERSSAMEEGEGSEGGVTLGEGEGEGGRAGAHGEGEGKK